MVTPGNPPFDQISPPGVRVTKRGRSRAMKRKGGSACCGRRGTQSREDVVDGKRNKVLYFISSEWGEGDVGAEGLAIRGEKMGDKRGEEKDQHGRRGSVVKFLRTSECSHSSQKTT